MQMRTMTYHFTLNQPANLNNVIIPNDEDDGEIKTIHLENVSSDITTLDIMKIWYMTTPKKAENSQTLPARYNTFENICKELSPVPEEAAQSPT